jgi:hypothetical protein
MERWAALAASDDLGEHERAELAAHLDQCEKCRTAVVDFSRMEADLASLKNDVLDPDVYAAIRQGVLDRIPNQRNWHVAAALALAAALILVTLAIWSEHRSQVAPLPIQPPPLQVSAPPVPAIVPAVEHRAKSAPRRHRRVDINPSPEYPLVVKMLTDDPNVVIIWLVDRDEKEIAR